MTGPQLRRSILHAIHQLTGSMEPWKHVGTVMRRYLGPWVGMTATERWETMGELELEILADAVGERAAMMLLQPDASPREVVICGGREYEPTRDDAAWCTWWLAFLAAKAVAHGGARGVDRWAGTLAGRLGLGVVVVEPDYEAHPPKVAPLVRNTEMSLRQGVIAVLALPGGSGTVDMCSKAHARGLPTLLRTDPATHVGRWAA